LTGAKCRSALNASARDRADRKNALVAIAPRKKSRRFGLQLIASTEYADYEDKQREKSTPMDTDSV
jgi:hypothetical protein